MVYEDGTTLEVACDHFAFESSYLKLTRWTLVLLRPREIVVQRLALRGARPIRGVLSDVQ